LQMCKSDGSPGNLTGAALARRLRGGSFEKQPSRRGDRAFLDSRSTFFATEPTIAAALSSQSKPIVLVQDLACRRVVAKGHAQLVEPRTMRARLRVVLYMYKLSILCVSSYGVPPLRSSLRSSRSSYFLLSLPSLPGARPCSGGVDGPCEEHSKRTVCRRDPSDWCCAWPNRWWGQAQARRAAQASEWRSG
jgi:hypothetical protein